MKKIDYDKLSGRLRKVRLAKGITQEYISNVADVNTSHISNIETNRTRLSLPTLVHYCNALGITVDYALGREYPLPASETEEQIMIELKKCPDNTKEIILRIVQLLQ